MYPLLKNALCAFILFASVQCFSQTVVIDPTKPELKSGFEVSPAKIYWELNAGDVTKAEILVTNLFPRKIEMKARFGDYYRDSAGKQVYGEPGSFKNSCTKWIGIDQKVFTIDSGGTAKVHVAMQLPKNDTSGIKTRWAILFLETVQENIQPPKNDSMRTRVKATFRVGIPIINTPSSVAQDKSMDLVSFKNLGDTAYQVTVQNTGKTELKLKSYVELTSLSTGEKVKVNAKDFAIFPDATRYTIIDAPKGLKKGKYNLLAVVDAGDDAVPLESSEATIEVK